MERSNGIRRACVYKVGSLPFNLWAEFQEEQVFLWVLNQCSTSA